MMDNRADLESRDVVVAAPLSFAGSGARIRRWRRHKSDSAWWGVACYALITLTWLFVLCWYLLWGLWLVPYRLVRRGQRKQGLAQARHDETLRKLGHESARDRDR
jgi:hypothetical protein